MNTQMIYNISDIRDYDALEIRDYWTVLSRFSNGSMVGWVDLHDVDKNFLNFMNVKWIFSEISHIVVIYPGLNLVKHDQGYRLYENPDVFSRAFTVNKAIMNVINLKF